MRTRLSAKKITDSKVLKHGKHNSRNTKQSVKRATGSSRRTRKENARVKRPVTLSYKEAHAVGKRRSSEFVTYSQDGRLFYDLYASSQRIYDKPSVINSESSTQKRSKSRMLSVLSNQRNRKLISSSHSAASEPSPKKISSKASKFDGKVLNIDDPKYAKQHEPRTVSGKSKLMNKKGVRRSRKELLERRLKRELGVYSMSDVPYTGKRIASLNAVALINAVTAGDSLRHARKTKITVNERRESLETLPCVEPINSEPELSDDARTEPMQTRLNTPPPAENPKRLRLVTRKARRTSARNAVATTEFSTDFNQVARTDSRIPKDSSITSYRTEEFVPLGGNKYSFQQITRQLIQLHDRSDCTRNDQRDETFSNSPTMLQCPGPSAPVFSHFQNSLDLPSSTACNGSSILNNIGNLESAYRSSYTLPGFVAPAILPSPVQCYPAGMLFHPVFPFTNVHPSSCLPLPIQNPFLNFTSFFPVTVNGPPFIQPASNAVSFVQPLCVNDSLNSTIVLNGAPQVLSHPSKGVPHLVPQLTTEPSTFSSITSSVTPMTECFQLAARSLTPLKSSSHEGSNSMSQHLPLNVSKENFIDLSDGPSQHKKVAVDAATLTSETPDFHNPANETVPVKTPKSTLNPFATVTSTSHTLSTNHSTGSDSWEWEGTPYRKRIFCQTDSVPSWQNCYRAIRHVRDGMLIRERDSVLLCSGPDRCAPPFVARITSLFADPQSGTKMMSLLWYYRPEHVAGVSLEQFVPNELCASRHCDTNPVDCIEDKAYVLTASAFSRYMTKMKYKQSTHHRVPLSRVVPRPSLPNDPNPDPVLEESECSPVVGDDDVPDSVPSSNVFLCRSIYDYRLKRICRTPNFHAALPSHFLGYTAHRHESPKRSDESDFVSVDKLPTSVKQNRSLSLAPTSLDPTHEGSKVRSPSPLSPSSPVLRIYVPDSPTETASQVVFENTLNKISNNTACTEPVKESTKTAVSSATGSSVPTTERGSVTPPPSTAINQQSTPLRNVATDAALQHSRQHLSGLPTVPPGPHQLQSNMLSPTSNVLAEKRSSQPVLTPPGSRVYYHPFVPNNALVTSTSYPNASGPSTWNSVCDRSVLETSADLSVNWAEHGEQIALSLDCRDQTPLLSVPIDASEYSTTATNSISNTFVPSGHLVSQNLQAAQFLPPTNQPSYGTDSPRLILL